MPGESSEGKRAPADPEEEFLIRRWLRTADEIVRGAARKGLDGKQGGEREVRGGKPPAEGRDGEV